MNLFSIALRYVRAWIVISTGAVMWSCHAGEPLRLAPVMTELGSVLLNEPFNDRVPSSWRPRPGIWAIVDGVLLAREDPSVQHAAVIRHPLVVANAVFTFSFRLGEARQINLAIGNATGHVCRLIVTPRDFTVLKDDNDHGGPDRKLVLQTVALELDRATWHTAMAEIYGEEMVAQINRATHVGFGAHPLLDGPKASFGLTAAGGMAEFRDVKVFEAALRPDWPAMRARLVTVR